MKIRCTLLCLLIYTVSFAQQPDTSVKQESFHTYERHTALASVSVGGLDYYRGSYSLPSGHTKGNTSGYIPVYIKLEYCLYRRISLAATFSYDAFVYNYGQDYTGNNGSFERYRTNKTRIVRGGFAVNYHLQDIIHIRHLDPFITVGISLSNIRYSAYPQGDTSGVQFDHIVAPDLRIGARYYLSSKFSLFADAGYDRQSVFSVGASARFMHKK